MAWLENNTTNAAPVQQPTQQSALAPAAPASTPMIATDGSARMIPNDAVNDATSAGYKPATKMIDPQGTPRWVPTEAVDQARSSNWAVAPQPGVTRMATPQGQLTYALPNEVEAFKKSGHVPIDDSGNFRVDPLPGEDNTDTMARAARIAKNLPPDVMKQAIAAEQKTFTPQRVAANLVAAPILGAATTAGLAGGSAGTAALFGPTTATTAGGVGFGGAAPAEVAGPSLATQGLQWLVANPWLKGAALLGGTGAGLGEGIHLAKKWLGK